MNPIKNVISGIPGRMAPLISFYTIFDLDIGLIQLIFDEYLDPNIFDIKFFQRSLKDIIRDIYYRKDENLLYMFSKESVKREVLDEYYKEFKETCMDKILDKCITTEIINMISLFKSTKEITPTILYYTDKQKELLDDEPDLINIPKIRLDQTDSNALKSYSQYYVKNIDELEPFCEYRGKTFYISNYGLNLNKESNDIKDDILLSKIAKNINNINLFSLYNEDIILKKKG